MSLTGWTLSAAARKAPIFAAALAAISGSGALAGGMMPNPMVSILPQQTAIRITRPLTAASKPAEVRQAVPDELVEMADTNKKIIWWGPFKSPTDITPQDLYNAGTAFDGFVVQNVRGSHDTPTESLQWEAFTPSHRYTLDPADTRGDYIGDSLDALKKLPAKPMPARFLRINSCPYNISGFNWLDDSFWGTVEKNLRVASRMCADAGLRGIFLDSEQYKNRTSPNVYLYTDLLKDPRYAGLSYAQLAEIVEKRGRQVIRALNSADPNITIIISFGYSSVPAPSNRTDIAHNEYLLVPFLDGMLGGSTATTTFVDGFEYGYYHNDDPKFYEIARRDILSPHAFVGGHQKYADKYARQYQFGVGLWLDRNSGPGSGRNEFGWCGDGRPKAFYTPGRWAYTVQQAAKSTDEFIWVYTQKPNAWLTPNTPGALPRPYIRATEEAMRHANDPSLKPLPADFKPAPENETCE